MPLLPGHSTLLLATTVSALGGLVFGYELGIISGALLQLRAQFQLSCVQQEALVSSLLIGALLASITGGCLIDRHGRRKSILLSNVLILAGSLVLLFSHYAALLLGRMVVGFAMCISSMSCCIYVSEMVTPERRGLLVTLYEAGITVGILAAYAMNYILSDAKRGWRWMFGFAVAPTLIQLFSIWFLPHNAAENVNKRDRLQTEGQLMSSMESQEADESKASSGDETDAVRCSSSYLFQRKDNMRTRTAIGLGLVLFQQFTGQPNVLFYASTIFHSVGFHSDASAVLASVGLGLVKVFATLTSMLFSDRVGRRPLLIGGCSVMALCLITIGLLSGRAVVDTQRPCNSEGFGVNRTDLPQVPVGNLSVSDASAALFHNSAELSEVNQKTLDSLRASSPRVRGSVVNWIILVCMMAVVSAYSMGFGPSLYTFSKWLFLLK